MISLRAALLLSITFAAACGPTYDPACRGRGEQQLDVNELAQPSGLALANGKLYVANAASIAPEGDYDYCGSFISVLDPASGKPLQRPIVPRDPTRDANEQEYRFFSGVTYDTERDVLYVLERQRGGLLKVNPSNGQIISRAASGHGPYDLVLASNVPTQWGGAAPVTRDVIVVADIGEGEGGEGHLWVFDAENISFRAAREVVISRGGRPSNLAYDAATQRLYVTLFDGTGINIIDLRTLETIGGTESVLGGYTMYVRGVAPVPATTGTQLYFTSESSAYDGIWVTDEATGQIIQNLKLPVAPLALGVYGERLVGVARNRLYVLDREPLRLVQTRILGTTHPARLLVDAANKRAYVSSNDPSAVRIVELP